MTLWLADAPLILASGSRTRADMLRAAGIPIEVEPAVIDERGLEERLSGEAASAEAVALQLARAKALAVSATRPGRYVLGADQTLACGARRFHKPGSREEAKAHLAGLAGRTHSLHAGFALVRDGVVVTEACERADLTMHVLSDDFLDAYLDAAGPAVEASVGAYQIEGLGAQLFESVDGAHSTILGLPLSPLLAVLRAEGLLLS